MQAKWETHSPAQPGSKRCPLGREIVGARMTVGVAMLNPERTTLAVPAMFRDP